MSQKITLVLASMIALYACVSGNEENTTESATPAVVTTPSSTAPMEAPDTSAKSLTAPPPNAAAPVNPTVRLNPPHGQPGHRCEIEVGQPLPPEGTPSVVNQPNTQTTNPVMQNPPPVMATPPANANILPGAPKGKVNPPHGEPGHRCDIAVGAPLN
jgi:hypothetical protein